MDNNNQDNNFSRTQILELLESLKVLDNPNADLEQYFTPSDLAYRFVSKLDVKDKVILDLASGPGILGFTALLLGAKKLVCVDIDPTAINISQNNYNILKEKYPSLGECEFVNKDVSLIKKSKFGDVDITLINPPFGTTDDNKKLDMVFLKKAMKLSNTVMSMHKTASKDFIESMVLENNFNVDSKKDFLFPIYKMYEHHKKDLVNIAVTLFVIKKNN